MHAGDVTASVSSGPLGQEIQTVRFPEVVTTIAWSPDGTHLAASNGRDNQVYLYDLIHDQLLWKASKTGPRSSTSLAFDEAGLTVITPSTINWGLEHTDTTLSLLDAQSGTVARQLNEEIAKGTVGTGRAEVFALSKDKSILAVIQGTSPNRILIYRTSTWEVSDHINPGVGGAMRIAIDDNGRSVMIGFVDGEVQVWDFSNNKLLNTIRTLNSTLAAMVFDPVNGLLISGGTGAIMTKRTMSGDKPDAFATLKDDPTTLLSAWNPYTGHKVVTYVGPGLGVGGLAVSPDGKYVAATKGKGPGNGSYLLVWDANSGGLIAQIDYNHTTAYGVAFSEDSRKLAIAVENEVRIVPISN